MILSAKDADSEKILGLNLGAMIIWQNLFIWRNSMPVLSHCSVVGRQTGI